MAIPSQTISILDPGLGLVGPSEAIPMVVGVTTGGTVGTIYTFSSKNDLRDTLEGGPAVETAARILTVAGGPVRVLKTAASVAGTNGSVTTTRVGSSTGTVAPSGTPNDSYEVQVGISATGGLGAGEFQYSLDDGRTFSAALTIPAGGVFVIPGTGLTLTFTDGAGPVFFEVGDLFEFDSVASHYNATDLDAAQTVLLGTQLSFDFVVYAGRAADGTTAATLAAVIAADMLELENQFRYVRAITDAGDDSEANWLTAFASFSDTRVSVGADTVDRETGIAFTGWGIPRRPVVDEQAARAAASLISTDLARVASGSLPGVVAIAHDEFLNETLDAAGFTTTRTWPNRTGFYLTNGRIMAPAGSDFQLWQFGRVMDVACATTAETQQLFSSISVRTNPPNVPNDGDKGTIDERDAVRLETRVEAALAVVLTEPKSAEGTPGHVSAFAYTIDRSNNVVQGQTIISEVAVQPLGYAKFITTQIGFTPALAA
jgi:hypothetical protein